MSLSLSDALKYFSKLGGKWTSTLKDFRRLSLVHRVPDPDKPHFYWRRQQSWSHHLRGGSASVIMLEADAAVRDNCCIGWCGLWWCYYRVSNQWNISQWQCWGEAAMASLIQPIGCYKDTIGCNSDDNDDQDQNGGSAGHNGTKLSRLVQLHRSADAASWFPQDRFMIIFIQSEWIAEGSS